MNQRALAFATQDADKVDATERMTLGIFFHRHLEQPAIGGTDQSATTEDAPR